MVNNGLYELVNDFRMAIESAKDNGDFRSDCRFKYFPRGCCDDTCYLLSEYLKREGYKCSVVTGSHYDGNPKNNCSHTWILLNADTVIDITGDQFKYDPVLCFDVSVYIGKETDFHKQFDENRFLEEPGIQLNDSSERKRRMRDLFQIITNYMVGEIR